LVIFFSDIRAAEKLSKYCGRCDLESNVTYEYRDESEEDAGKCDVDDVVVRLALKVQHEEQLRIVDARSHTVADLLPQYLRLNQVPHPYIAQV